MRSTVAAGLTLLVSLLSSAASAGAVPYTCTANVAVPPTVRAEGLTELMGDLVLTCTGDVPENGISVNLTVSLGTNITSKVIGAASEALVLIDDPAPGSQTLGTNVFEGVVTGNQVRFSNVPVGPAPGGDDVQHVIRFVNIRADVNALAASAVLVVPMLAAISVSGASSLPISNPIQTVAFAQPGSAFSAHCAGGFVELRFTELFPTSYKVRGTNDQNVPGTIYNTESGFTPKPILSGSPGFADTGTELAVQIDQIADGVTFSVPPTITSGGLTLNAVIPPGGGDVPIAGGQALIAYEVVDADPLQIDDVVIPLQVSSVARQPPPIVVFGNLFPISTVHTASDSAPIPRFADVSVGQEVPIVCTGAPVVSPLALMALALGLLGVGVLMVRRRAR